MSPDHGPGTPGADPVPELDPLATAAEPLEGKARTAPAADEADSEGLAELAEVMLDGVALLAELGGAVAEGLMGVGAAAVDAAGEVAPAAGELASGAGELLGGAAEAAGPVLGGTAEVVGALADVAAEATPELAEGALELLGGLFDALGDS